VLHISADEQRHRLLRRLDKPKKHWKFDPGDIEDRALWSEYRAAYETVLRRTNTDAAPWFIVPSDRKWHRNWAVAQLLLETLESLDLAWPRADFDVEEQRRRLTEEGFGD
jgi:polyphosphate kinase 2 (PPK2 family)